jgi:hypothetical protein
MIPRAVVTKMEQPLCLKITSILKEFTSITTSTAHHYTRAAKESIKLREGNMRLPSGGRIKKLCENTLLL